MIYQHEDEHEHYHDYRLLLDDLMTIITWENQYPNPYRTIHDASFLIMGAETEEESNSIVELARAMIPTAVRLIRTFLTVSTTPKATTESPPPTPPPPPPQPPLN